jgi:hypothetical protein
MALEAKRRRLVLYNDIKIGGEPVGYDSETGEVLIQGERLDGHLLIELAARVKKSRVREGRDLKPGLGSGGNATFVALSLDADGVLREQRDAAWTNLPLYYPEKKRTKVSKRVVQARALIEK